MALSDDDRTRFFRLTSVILEELTPILQDLLQNEISPSQIFLVVKQKHFKELTSKQILVISNAKAVGCYKEFDITLLYTILRNYCPNIQPPTKKWGLQTMPDIRTETTLGDDIERIRIIRNNLFGHISTPAVPENEFEEHWSTISDICTRIDAKLPNKQYVKKLEEAKERTIDSHTEKIFMDTIKKLVENELSLKEMILKFIEERELTSRENVTIAAKVGQKKNHAEAFSDMCIRVLNIVVETINELTSESEIEQIYKSVENFFRDGKENVENKNLEDMLQRLQEKIIQYAKLQKGNTTKILLRCFQFNLDMKKMYDASVESSKGSLILTFTFSSKKGYDLYKKDLERGIIGQKILQLVLYPPYLASFDLQAEDLVVFLNGQKLTKDSGDKSASAERDDNVEGYFYWEKGSSSKMGIQKDFNKMAQESEKQKRAKFTAEETAALIEIIGNRRDFNNRKYIGKKKDLEKAWAQITLLFNNAKFGPISTSQRLKKKWMRMLMEDKKDHEAATGGDLISKSASAESEDNLKGWENDSSSKMGQKGMSVVKESPGPGTNTDISATSQAPCKRIRTDSLTPADGCSSQNWQDEELEKTIAQLSRKKRELEIQKLRKEIRNLKDENKESKK